MSDPMMTKFRCTVHNIVFGAEVSVDIVLIRCPRCASEQLEQLHRDIERLTEHRDVLLEAIDLKRTLEPAKAGGAS